MQHSCVKALTGASTIAAAQFNMLDSKSLGLTHILKHHVQATAGDHNMTCQPHLQNSNQAGITGLD
jgi:type IV secretory pathway protease TraF